MCFLTNMHLYFKWCDPVFREVIQVWNMCSCDHHGYFDEMMDLHFSSLGLFFILIEGTSWCDRWKWCIFSLNVNCMFAVLHNDDMFVVVFASQMWDRCGVVTVGTSWLGLLGRCWSAGGLRLCWRYWDWDRDWDWWGGVGRWRWRLRRRRSARWGCGLRRFRRRTRYWI